MSWINNLKGNIIKILKHELSIVEKKKTSNIIDSYVTEPHKIDSSTQIISSEIVGHEITIGKNGLIYKSKLQGNISVGNNTSINGPGTEIFSGIHPITIGSYCSIARNTAIQEVNHNFKSITTYFIKQRVFGEKTGIDAVSKGAITIGNDVWIGTQCAILTGVTIGHGCVIAANSVVTYNIPPYSIVGGTPAKIIKKRFSDEIIDALLNLEWWNWETEKIKRNYNLFDGELTLEKLNNIK